MLVSLVNAACDLFACEPVNLKPDNIIQQSVAAKGSGLWTAADAIYSWSHNQLLSRFCVLLHLNHMIGRVLPLLSLSPREDVGFIGAGCSTTMRIPEHPGATATATATLTRSHLLRGVGRWHNDSLAACLRAHRGCLFTASKLGYWNAVLNATATPTPLSQDEYEDPREIRLVKLNRGPRAQKATLAALSNMNTRIKRSVFGQLFTEVRTWNYGDMSLRRSYLGKGHGGQKRAFKVKFVGEGVNDYGGPYRAVFEQIVDELQSEIAGDECVLPFFLPSANR